jgi:hypothetical protein
LLTRLVVLAPVSVSRRSPTYVGIPYALAAIAISSACGPVNKSAASLHMFAAYNSHTAFLSHYATFLQCLATMAFNQTLQSIDRSAKIRLLLRPDEHPHARQSNLIFVQYEDLAGAARIWRFTQVRQKPGPWVGQCRIDICVVIEWEFRVSPNSRVGRPNKVAHGERPISMQFMMDFCVNCIDREFRLLSCGCLGNRICCYDRSMTQALDILSTTVAW